MGAEATLTGGTLEAPAAMEAVTTDFVECYHRHYGRLVRALRLAGGDPGTAEEVAQEAFARALSRWDRVCRGPNPTGYVYTAAFRLLRRQLARSSRWDVGEPPEQARPSDDSPGSEVTDRLTGSAILAAMPPKRRACAVLCLLIGLPTDEAAAALGIAAGTVRKHLEQARRDLEAVRP